MHKIGRTISQTIFFTLLNPPLGWPANTDEPAELILPGSRIQWCRRCSSVQGVNEEIGLAGAPQKYVLARMSTAAAQPHQIREVWADNLETEMQIIRELLPKYPYVAMDTEFPGIVARPLGSFRTQSEFIYQTLRCNVDMLKIIQLGITLADEQGNFPPNVCTWQFNFKFSLENDMYSQESIDLLTSCGIDFARFEKDGMDAAQFGELLITSGLVLLPNVKWISFHSGYDFGYLLKVLMANPLPSDEVPFFELLRLFFPSFYDIKYLMKSCKSLKGGLQDIADDLGIERVGIQHQAGSDSLLTAKAFFKIKHVFFDDHMDDAKYSGFLFGLASELPATASSALGKLPGSGSLLTASGSASDIAI